MAFSLTKFAIVILSITCSCQLAFSSEDVPVFMWGDLERASQKSNPLAKVSEPDFEVILKDELQNEPFTVIFMEETLSVEDFSKKSSDGDSAFPYLRSNLGDALYLPSVSSALRALNKLADPEKVDHIQLTENGLSAEIEPETGKYLFINLQDAKEGESRIQLLRRHNDFMEDMFSKLQEKYDRLVAVYTARFPSWTIPQEKPSTRVRRAVKAARDESGTVYDVNGSFLLYAKSIYLILNNRTEELKDPLSKSAVLGPKNLEVTLAFTNHTLLMNFTTQSGYWFLTDVEVSDAEQTMSQVIRADNVYAIIGFSYHCSNSVHYRAFNSTFELQFNDMQMEPFFNNKTNSRFGESFDCVGFTSVPIWAGLFVVFIMLMILFYGVTMMLDIRTMDRFDDPKGKTITINTSE